MKRETAVALRYDTAFPAPFVVARGRGELAAKLEHIAEEHGIPRRNDSELAEALYWVEVGAYIPEPFYLAVAEILSAVRSIERGRGTGEADQG
jgi:flagellar biosynthesis protein